MTSKHLGQNSGLTLEIVVNAKVAKSIAHKRTQS
jgi:hypothetical protein